MKQGDLMTDAAAKMMCLRLAEMEDAHYNILATEIDSINGNGFWLGLPEFMMYLSPSYDPFCGSFSGYTDCLSTAETIFMVAFSHDHLSKGPSAA